MNDAYHNYKLNPKPKHPAILAIGVVVVFVVLQAIATLLGNALASALTLSQQTPCVGTVPTPQATTKHIQQ